MNRGPRWDVFLAYASPDRDRALVLYRELAATGLRVFIDQAILRPGDNWHRELPRNLRASEVVVALVSSYTVDATFENSEILLALDQVRREGARLVPVRLHRDAELPYGTQALHAMDYFDDRETRTVVDAIADVVRNPSTVAAMVGSQVWCDRIPGVPVVFAGRDALLDRLKASTSGGGRAVLTQTIQGMGGVGKTTVAAALAELHRHELDVVWWIRAEHPAVLVADLAELAGRVGLPIRDDPAAAAVAAREWLEGTTRRWLVVFDNAPDEPSLERWRPRRGTGATIVTSRNRNMGRIGEVIPVDTFTPEVGRAFLRERLAKRNPAAAEDLTEVLGRLGGLPLALEQAAAWVERVPNRRFAWYVRMFDDASLEPFPDGTRPLGYDHTAGTAWRVSIQAATAEAPYAGRLLSVLAFLGPDELPCAWLREFAEARHPFFDVTSADVEEGLAALHGYSLADVSSLDTVSVHRVVQAAARRAASPDAAACAIALLKQQSGVRVAGELTDSARWPTFAALVPHAFAVAATMNAVLDTHARDLLAVLGQLITYHIERGAYAEAVSTGRLAVQIATTNLGADELETLVARNSLACAYWSAGNFETANSLHQAHLDDCERVLGADHPHTLFSRHNISGVFERAGDLDGAISQYESTLTARQRVLGDDHPDTLFTRNALAGAYQSAGHLEKAIAMYETTLAARTHVLGADHAHTLDTRNQLVFAYMSAGDHAWAITLSERIVADCERVLGADHPLTLWSRHHRAGAYFLAGNLHQAVALGEASLAEYERVLGPEHHSTFITRGNLAKIYASVGNLQRAIALYEASLAHCEKVLGPRHPATLKTRESLAASRKVT